MTTLVDLELKRLEDARREQGWTPWILLAAIAALSWHLTDYFAQAKNWTSVCLYWATFVVVGLTVESSIQSLNARRVVERRGVRYFHPSLLSAGRAARLFVAVEIAASAGLLCWLTPLAGPVRVIWLGLFGFYVYAIFGHVLGSWTDLPYPVGEEHPEKRHAWLKPLLFWILHVVVVAFVITAVWPRLTAMYFAADARVGLLAFAVTYLIGLLLSYGVNEPVRQELIHLRRAIGLGEIDAGKAKQRLIELLYGSELSVILRPLFESVEEKLTAFDQECQTAGEALAAWPEQRYSIGAMSPVREAERRFDDAQTAWMTLYIRLLISRLAGGTPTDVAEYGGRLKDRVKRSEAQLKELKVSLKKLS